MSHKPLVSVVMPTFNAEKYLGEAIESLLRQTFTNFELIIVNDGSTDNSAQVAAWYQARDSRVRLLHQSNSGTAASMNRGCRLARGKYIARMDSDDVCHPLRLERQVDFLEKNPDISICGTWMHAFQGKKKTLLSFPTDPDIAKSMLLFQLSVVGGSIMFTRDMYLQTGVRNKPNVGATDDYLFVVEFSKHSRVASIPEPLYLYRIHPAQISTVEKDRENRFARQIRLMQLEELGIQPDEDELDIHQAISCWRLLGEKSEIAQAENWLMKLKQANALRQLYPEPAFSQVLCNYWFSFCLRHSRFGSWTYQRFAQTRLAEGAKVGWAQRMKLFAKCMTSYSPSHG